MDAYTRYLEELNAGLIEALEIVSANLSNDDGQDPEAWWLELNAEQAALIRAVVAKAKAPLVAIPSTAPFPPIASVPVAKS